MQHLRLTILGILLAITGFVWAELYRDKAPTSTITFTHGAVMGCGELSLERLYPLGVAAVNLPRPGDTFDFYQTIMKRKGDANWLPPRLEAAYILNISPLTKTSELQKRAKAVTNAIAVIQDLDPRTGSHCCVEPPLFKWLQIN